MHPVEVEQKDTTRFHRNPQRYEILRNAKVSNSSGLPQIPDANIVRFARALCHTGKEVGK